MNVENETPDLEKLLELAKELGYPEHISTILSEGDLIKFQDMFIENNPRVGYNIAEHYKEEDMLVRARQVFAESQPVTAAEVAEREKDKDLAGQSARILFDKGELNSAYKVAKFSDNKKLLDEIEVVVVVVERDFKKVCNNSDYELKFRGVSFAQKFLKKIIQRGWVRKAEELWRHVINTDEIDILIGYKHLEKGNLEDAYHSSSEPIFRERVMNALLEEDFDNAYEIVQESDTWSYNPLEFMVAEELFDRGEVRKAYDFIERRTDSMRQLEEEPFSFYWDFFNELMEILVEQETDLDKLSEDSYISTFLIERVLQRSIDEGKLREAEKILYPGEFDSHRLNSCDELRKELREAYVELDSQETLDFGLRTDDKEIIRKFAYKAFHNGEFLDAYNKAKEVKDDELVRDSIEGLIGVDPEEAYAVSNKDQGWLIDKARNEVLKLGVEKALILAQKKKDDALIVKCGLEYVKQGNLDEAKKIAMEHGLIFINNYCNYFEENLNEKYGELFQKLADQYFEKKDYSSAKDVVSMLGDHKRMLIVGNYLFELGDSKDGGEGVQEVTDAYYIGEKIGNFNLLDKTRKSLAEKNFEWARQLAYDAPPGEIRDPALLGQVALVDLKQGDLNNALWNSYHSEDELIRDVVMNGIAEQKGRDPAELKAMYPMKPKAQIELENEVVLN